MSNRNASNGEGHPRDKSPPADRNERVALTMKGVGSKPWIMMRTDLWDDPRVAAMCDLLKATEAIVIGGLFRLWSIGNLFSTNGELRGLTPEWLDRKTGIDGFAVATERVGWLLIGDGILTIPEFDIHNSQSAKSRAQAARRKQSQRARNASDKNDDLESVTPPSRGQRDKSVTRTEKSRADKKPPPAPSTLAPNANNASKVEAVEVLLSEFGIKAARTTARESADRGYTANHVRELLDWLRSRGDRFNDPKAALVFRLRNSPPATPVDQGWPDAKTKLTATRTSQEARLETQFGSKLNLMRYPELRALAKRAGFANAEKLSDDELQVLRAKDTANRRKLIEQLARDHSPREQGDKPS